jgi:hypothetical protein
LWIVMIGKLCGMASVTGTSREQPQLFEKLR